MVTLTAGAVSEVKRLLARENKPEFGLRIGVRTGGCSGMSYMLGFDAPHADDQVQEVEGIKLLIDPQSAKYIEDTQVDYLDGLQGKGFTFHNPKATRTCGCGESFSV